MTTHTKNEDDVEPLPLNLLGAMAHERRTPVTLPKLAFMGEKELDPWLQKAIDEAKAE